MYETCHAFDVAIHELMDVWEMSHIWCQTTNASFSRHPLIDMTDMWRIQTGCVTLDVAIHELMDVWEVSHICCQTTNASFSRHPLIDMTDMTYSDRVRHVPLYYDSFPWKRNIPKNHQIEKLSSLGILQCKFKLRFWLHMNLYCGIWVSWFDGFRGCAMFSGICRTRWQRLIGCLKLQVVFHKRATNYRALLRKMKHKDKASYESSPHCNDHHNAPPLIYLDPTAKTHWCYRAHKMTPTRKQVATCSTLLVNTTTNPSPSI